MGSLLVISGPPGAEKSSVARLLADEAATRTMHAEFDRTVVGNRHVLRNLSGDPSAVANAIESARQAGALSYAVC